MIKTIISNKHLPKDLNFQEGFLLLVDKPKDWTSFDVVNKVRFACKHKLGQKKYKVGHAGTLDPLATGLLLICCGKYTKLIDQLQNQDKSYQFQLKLGFRTETYDAESEEIFVANTEKISKNNFEEALDHFRGDIMQKPPIYSAIKIKGQALYKLARKGQNVEIKPRPVRISKLDLVNFDPPLAELDMACTKGTYVRSLANDIGENLGVGAYVTQLRRTEVEQFKVEDALTIDQIIDFIKNVDIIIPE